MHSLDSNRLVSCSRLATSIRSLRHWPQTHWELSWVLYLSFLLLVSVLSYSLCNIAVIRLMIYRVQDALMLLPVSVLILPKKTSLFLKCMIVLACEIYIACYWL